MRHKNNVKKERVSAMIPKSEKIALDRMAADNSRSSAAEIRIAISERLKREGRMS